MSRTAYGVAVATLAFVALVMEVVVGNSVPVRVPLQEFPFEISSWMGRAEVMKVGYLERARPDEFLYRRYTDAIGRELFLYVGYYGRQATRGQVNALCYGQCQVASRGREILVLNGQAVQVNRAEVVQEGIRMAVLFWYQRGSTVTQDPYRDKIEQVRRVLRSRRSDGAFVRVAVPVISSEYEARERGMAFARALFPLLRQHLPD